MSNQVKGLPPGLAKRVQVIDNIAYVAIGDQLQIVDITDSSNPVIKGAYIGTVNYVTVVGTFAYVCGDTSGLKIIDVSNPMQPVETSVFVTGAVESIVVSGSYAYVPDPINGLQIIDITNPAQPTLKSSYKPSGAISEVAVVGNYAYLVNEESGLTIVDVTDPANPTLKSTFDTPGVATKVTVVGNYALVSDTTSLQVIDITNPASPTFVSSYQIAASQAITVINNLVYVTDDDGDDDDDGSVPNVKVLDISNPTKLIFKGVYSLSETAGSIATAGDQLYVFNVTGSSSQATYSLQVIDSRIGIPLLPVKFGKIEFKLRGTSRSEIVRGTLLSNDFVSGNAGDDQLFGGMGKAMAGDDHLLGDDGDDTIFAGVGKDKLDGGKGNDTLDGGNGKDLLIGGEGDDVLSGSNGQDILICGAGKNALKGGRGRDMYVFQQVESGDNTVVDFNVRQDVIDLREIFALDTFKITGASSFDRFEQFIKVEQMGANTQVKIDIDGQGAGTTFVSLVMLTGVQATNVSASNFAL
ncbi:MAG: hypothetical protein Kow00121_62400 [Elainellaceae cyanobacterium]